MTIRVRVCQAPTCTCTYWWMVNKHLLARVHTIEMPVEKHVSYVASTHNLWIYWIWLYRSCIDHVLIFQTRTLSHRQTQTHSKDTFGESKKKEKQHILWLCEPYCQNTVAKEKCNNVSSVCVCVCGVFRIREIRNAIQNNFHDISNAFFFRRHRRRRCPDCCCAHMST